MNIAAKPTLYNGIMFRSRLEARWASMFDLLGWRYEYEPMDLLGYVPDFVLKGSKQYTFVEVKPLLWDGSSSEDAAIGLAEHRAEEALPCHEVLILGASAMFNDDCIGWLKHEDGGGFGDDRLWDWARWGSWAIDKFGFCSSSQSWRDRISGEYHSGCFGISWRSHSPLTITALWNRAGTATRWTGEQNGKAKHTLNGHRIRLDGRCRCD